MLDLFSFCGIYVDTSIPDEVGSFAFLSGSEGAVRTTAVVVFGVLFCATVFAEVCGGFSIVLVMDETRTR